LGDSTQLIFLRGRYYNPTDGRFLSRDTWAGKVSNPLSFNHWNYTNSNPINYRDPLGLWSIAPGFELSDGGIYGQGQLTVPSALCSETCWTSSSPQTTVSIFVPQKVNGVLYNDIMYQSPTASIFLHWDKYDIIQRSLLRCHQDEIVVPTNTNAWNTIAAKSGNSHAFSRGGFADLTVGMATGMGYDSGFVPLSIQLDPSSYYSVNASIAFQLFSAQSQAERDRFNFVEIFDTLTAERIESGVGAFVFSANFMQGMLAFNSRAYTISIQEHKSIRKLYRTIIETTSAFQNVKTREVLIPSSFLSFENGSWKEHGFNLARSSLISPVKPPPPR
jgi:RHS repeat-associated protein